MRHPLIATTTVLVTVIVTISSGLTSFGQTGSQRTIQKPLPSRFFNEETMVLARIDVGSANIERVFETVSALVPSNVVQTFQSQQQKAFTGGPSPASSLAALATLRQLADNPSIVNQLKRQRPNEPLAMVDVAAKQLLNAKIRSLYVVVMRNPANESMPSIFFLTPKEMAGSKASDRKSAFETTAKMVNSRVSQDGAWLVASSSPLPGSGDDFGLDEAAFLEALRSNPKHDFMVAFVPTEAMREQARTGWDQMAKNSPPEERAILPLAKQLIQILDGDWFYASVQLGDTPSVRLSAHFADNQKPKKMEAALNQLIDAMPRIAPVKSSPNPTIQKVRQSNARVQFQLFQFLKFQSQDAFLTCDVDSQALQGLVSKTLEFQNEPADNSPSSIDPTAGFGK